MKTKSIFKRGAMATVALSSLFLIGCGGGGSSYTAPAVYGPIGSASSTYTEAGVTANVATWAEVWDSASSVSVGDDPTAVYDSLSQAGKNLVDALPKPSFTLSSLTSLTANDVSLIKNSVASGIENEFVSHGFTRPDISVSDVDFILGEINSAGASSAWRQGWIGTGVSLGFESGVASNEAATSVGIAPGTDVHAPSDFASSDIQLWGNGNISFANGIQNVGNPAHQDAFNFTPTFGQGKAAGIGALVMQKFPSAPNTAVGGAVINSNGNALSALSPSF